MQSSKYVSENFFELIGLSLKIFECGLSIANYSIVRQMLDERIQIIDPHVNTLEFIDHIFIKFKSISIDQQQENFQLQNIDPESIIKILDLCNQMKNSITNKERKVLQQRQETLDYQEILWSYLIQLKLNLINNIEVQNESPENDNVGRFPIPIKILNGLVEFLGCDYEKIFDKALNLQKYYQRCQVPEEFIDNLIFDTYQTNLRNYQLRLQIEDRVEFIRQEIQKIMEFIEKSLLFKQICSELLEILGLNAVQGINLSQLKFKFMMMKDFKIQGITIINGIAYINLYQLLKVFKDKVQLIRAIIGYTVFLLTHEFAHYLDQMILQSWEMNTSRKSRTHEEKQQMKRRAFRFDVYLDDNSLKFVEVGDLLEALLYGIKHKQQQRGDFFFNSTLSDVITNESNWKLSKSQFQIKINQSQTPHEQEFEMRKVKK